MQTISRQQVKTKLERGEALNLIDLQDPEGFEESHLPKALNVPFGHDFADRLRYAFPNLDAELVVYNYGGGDELVRAVSELRKVGYTRVLALEEGKSGWSAAGLPTTC